jgi:hypothetical protein
MSIIKVPNESIAGGIYVSAFDYLAPDINRPDIFSDRTSIKSSISRGQNRPSTVAQVLSTLGLVVLSGFLFVTIVAWATVLQSYLDSIFINPIINSLTVSRLWYAGIVTAITLIVLIISVWFFIIYKREHPSNDQN